MIRKKLATYKPTPREFDALTYLADEWDFAYDLRVNVQHLPEHDWRKRGVDNRSA